MIPDYSELLHPFGHDRTRLLDMLWRIQESRGGIPGEAVAVLSRRLGLTAGEIREVIGFYHFLHDEPLVRHRIHLADTVIARMGGFEAVRDALERAAGCRLGETSPDALFGLHRVPCIGQSDREPAMLVDGLVCGDLTPERAMGILQRLRRGETAAAVTGVAGRSEQDREFVETLSPGTVQRAGPLFFRDGRDHARLLRSCLELTPEQIIDTIDRAGLRGRGGAGFPTARKWRLTREQPAPGKTLICNADEGEPGTFKDRVLLTRSPCDVFTGMIAAARAIGAEQGILYLRAEYRYLLPWLQGQLQRLRDQGLLGRGILGQAGFHFDIRIQSGAGAYVCGDETALIESCEGRRGTPRLKPPFPIQHGFLGRPTCVNNVETFAAVSAILELGAERFRALGTEESAGTRLLSVSGDCDRPGIHEIEWGVTLEQVLEQVGARDPVAVQVSGPAGECVDPAREGGRRFCYSDLSCNGSLMLFGRDRDLLRIVHHFTAFFVDESCGICVPCRSGNPNLLQRLERVIAGRACRQDLADLAAWGRLVGQTSRCGLGGSSARPILTTLERFPSLYRRGLAPAEGTLRPWFDPDAALDDYRRLAAGERE